MDASPLHPSLSLSPLPMSVILVPVILPQSFMTFAKATLFKSRIQRTQPLPKWREVRLGPDPLRPARRPPFPSRQQWSLCCVRFQHLCPETGVCRQFTLLVTVKTAASSLWMPRTLCHGLRGQAFQLPSTSLWLMCENMAMRVKCSALAFSGL